LKTPLNHSRAITKGDRNEPQPENPKVVRKRLEAMPKDKIRWFSRSSTNPLWKKIAAEILKK
jgi:hypothetical protein